MTQTALSIAASEKHRADASIGALLLAAGKLSADKLEHVLHLQQQLGIRFGEAARRMGLVSEADVAQALARQFDYPYLQPGEGALSPHLAAAYDPFSPQVEVVRAVRSQLMLRWFGHGHKSLAVVGVGRGDGASLFTANLALVFAQLGERTLLVDANLRWPAQHDVFGLPPGQGLSDILAGRAALDVAAPVAPFAGLTLLRAGAVPPNPHELLARSNFGGLHAQLESRHDVTLYDVASSATGLDALVLATRTGGVLIVVRKNKTHLGDVEALAAQVAHHGGAVVGSVLVDFP